MNNTEAVLLSIAIVILLGLIIFSVAFSSRSSRPKSAQSQAESLKNMLNEYALKVKKEQSAVDIQFGSVDVDIPTKIYEKYDNTRAVEEMGLTQEEADGFVLELIKVIDAEIPRIEAAFMKGDYKAVEEIVHTITGTSSTLGSGGISSALIDFYSAVQHHDSIKKLYVHLQNVKFYLDELKKSTL